MTTRSRRTLSSALSACTILWMCWTARAEDVSSIVEVLEDSVVTGASLTAERASEAPAMSSTITAEQLKLFGIRRLDEAINFLSLGMFSHDRMSAPELGARGVAMTRDGNSHVLVVLDGTIVNEQSGGTSFLYDIPMEVVDHIEIILGPGSVLYGAQAMFGVINVVTKSAREQGGFRGSAVFGGSPPMTRAGSIARPTIDGLGHDNKYTLSYGKPFRLLGQEAGFLASLHYDDFDGPRIVFPKQELPRDEQGEPAVDLGPHAQPGYWGGPVENQWYRRTLGGYARFDVAGLSLSVRGTTTRMGVPQLDLYENRVGLYDDPRNKDAREFVLSSLSYRRRITARIDLLSRLSFGYSRNQRDRFAISHDPRIPGVPLGVLDPEQCPTGPTGPCREEARFFSRWVGLELQSSYDWWGDGRFSTMLGANGRLRTSAYEYVTFDVLSGESYGSDPAQTRWHGGGNKSAEEQALGAYLQQVLRPWKYVTLNGGARLDLDSRIPARYLSKSLSPRVALIVTPTEQLAFKLIYSRAFRAPSFVELYSVNGRLLPNPDGLKPETVDSYETVGSLHVGSHSLNVGGFYAQWHDLIELKIVKAQAPSVSHFANVPGIDNYGGNLSYECSLLERRLRLGVNATYARARRKLSDEQIAQNAEFTSEKKTAPVTVAPPLFGNARASYAYGTGAVALAFGYFGRRIADQAYYGGVASNLAPRPTAPPQLETRLTLTGSLPGVRGVDYLVGASYALSPYQPYVVGPNQGQPRYLVPKTIDADLAFVNRLSVFAGLSVRIDGLDEESGSQDPEGAR